MPEQSGRRRRDRDPLVRLIRRLFGDIADDAVRAIEMAVFWVCLALWILGSVLGGVFFGATGFLVVLWLPLVPLVVFLVRRPFRIIADRRGRGLPAVDRGAVGCWLGFFGAIALVGVLLFLGARLLEWAMTR